jgi:UDP-glucose 4-epimerase
VNGTFRLLQAMREAGTKRIVYTSGSGVYGTTVRCNEETASLPVSAYGAAKTAAEAWIHAFSVLYGIGALVFRPANITGPGATHGVVYDFVQKLKADPTRLDVLGNGQQFKAYMHVDDVVNALLLPITGTFNLTNDDFLTVEQIANLVAQRMGLAPAIRYGSSFEGWPGDVPVVRLESARLVRCSRWDPTHSATDAVLSAVDSLTMKVAA